MPVVSQRIIHTVFHLSVWSSCDNISRHFWLAHLTKRELNAFQGICAKYEHLYVSVRARTCITVFQCVAILFLFLSVLPKPQVSYKTTSPGVIEANCTSVSRPPAEIVWNVERDNRTMGPPVTTHIPQGDGTTLVISTLTVQSGLLKDVSVKCLVHHKGLESPIGVSMNTKSELVFI